jgi:hypothetical protein
MKIFSVCSLALLSVSIPLQAQLNVPQLGLAHYADGTLHLVRGIGANMIVERDPFAAADTACFSDSVGVFASSGSIHLVRIDGTTLGEYHANEASPILHVDTDATSTAIWLPSSHSLLTWDGNHFIETPVNDALFGGAVTFVNLVSSTSAQFFVARPDQSIARVSVALPSGQVTSSDIEPLARGWIFVQQGWSLSQVDTSLIAERTNGTQQQTIALSEKTIPAGDLRVEQMSNHWLHVSSQSLGTNWAIYLDQNKLNSFLLPPPTRQHLRAPRPPAHEVNR